jgi:hypothetical protein
MRAPCFDKAREGFYPCLAFFLNGDKDSPNLSFASMDGYWDYPDFKRFEIDKYWDYPAPYIFFQMVDILISIQK